MNAIVEVTTAEVVVETVEARVIAKIVHVLENVKVAIHRVVTSTKRVPSIAGTSISAVSPDYILIGGTA